MGIWDDPDLQPGAGKFVKFETEGQSVQGVIKSIGKHRWDDGKFSPQLVITTDTGDDVTVTAPAALARKLTEERPEVGDAVRITYLKAEVKQGPKGAYVGKTFSVSVRRNAAPAQTTPPAPAYTEPPF